MVDDQNEEKMTLKTAILFILLAASCSIGMGQAAAPSTATRPFVVKTKQQLSDITKEIEATTGNQQVDIASQKGTQMRVALFHDVKRENDLHEVHDGSDDVYYVLDGEATLMLGGSLIEPNQISTGEWRSKNASGGQALVIHKGDLIVVPRGTPHQRTVTGKGFSMILIKIFEVRQP